jgi:hypothetical protein
MDAYEAKTPRELARLSAERAGFWGRCALANIKAEDVTSASHAAKAAAHHYRRREELLGRGGRRQEQ